MFFIMFLVSDVQKTLFFVWFFSGSIPDVPASSPDVSASNPDVSWQKPRRAFAENPDEPSPNPDALSPNPDLILFYVILYCFPMAFV